MYPPCHRSGLLLTAATLALVAAVLLISLDGMLTDLTRGPAALSDGAADPW